MAEPLHLKNNVCKELFVKLYAIVSTNCTIATSIKIFKDIPEDNLLVQFVAWVKKEMKCNKLSKKLKEWWASADKELSFRFRGEESRNFLSGTYHTNFKSVFFKVFN